MGHGGLGSGSGWSALATAIAVVLALPGTALAQSTVHVEVEVYVEAAPPPLVEIVVAPAPPVEVVMAPPAPEPEPVPEPEPAPAPTASVAPVLSARGLVLLSDEHSTAALGGAVGIGGSLRREWSGAIVAGYLGEVGRGASEIDLGIEIAKDFAPESAMGFYVLFGIGAAFVLGDPDDPRAPSGPRMMGQLGIGARVSVSESIAITLDARGVLRYALPEVDSFHHDGTISGGAMLTLGLAMRL